MEVGDSCLFGKHHKQTLYLIQEQKGVYSCSTLGEQWSRRDDLDETAIGMKEAWGHHELVYWETTSKDKGPLAPSSMQNLLRCLILNKQIRWMKFKEGIIIASKPMDRNKIFACLGNIKNIIENKILVRGANKIATNLIYLHS